MSYHTQEQTSLRLILLARKGDTKSTNKILGDLDADLKKLINRYCYYISGSDKQDVLQEGRIGIWKAIQDFDENGGMTFRNFAINICCKRHIITAIAQANRKKYDPLNNAELFSTPVISGDDESEQSVADFIPDNTSSALDDILSREELKTIFSELRKKLTKLEDSICLEYAKDESYKDIAKKLNIKAKAVDNALMRIRKKAAEVFDEYQNDNTVED